MNKVKTYEEWNATDGRFVASSQKLWDAAQENVPEKVCEWTVISPEGWLTGCDVKAEFRCNNCQYCGRRITIKPELTVDQKLEAMTVKYDALEQDLIRYMNIANDTEQKLAGMTKELDVQIANNKALMAELSVVAKERNRLCSRDTFMSMKVNQLQSELNDAELRPTEQRPERAVENAVYWETEFHKQSDMIRDNRTREKITDALLATAELHLAELVKLSIGYTKNSSLQAELIRNYIRDNGMET